MLQKIYNVEVNTLTTLSETAPQSSIKLFLSVFCIKSNIYIKLITINHLNTIELASKNMYTYSAF